MRLMASGNEERAGPVPDPWRQWIGQSVVIDTDSQYVYLGRLAGVDACWVAVEDADVHDVNESYATRERYLIEAAELGIKATRRHVWLLRERVVSMSRLEDVLRF